MEVLKLEGRLIRLDEENDFDSLQRFSAGECEQPTSFIEGKALTEGLWHFDNKKTKNTFVNSLILFEFTCSGGIIIWYILNIVKKIF